MNFNKKQILNIHESLEYLKYDDENEITFFGSKSHDLLGHNNSMSMIYFDERIKDNYYSIYNAFNKYFKNLSIHFALKCNYIPACIETLLSVGSSIEVMSSIELQIALQSGFKKDKIVCNGLGKSKEELLIELENSKLIFIDNINDLERINSLSVELGKEIPIGLRVLPDIESFSHEEVMIKPSSKLGMDVNTVTGILKQCKEKNVSFNVIGIQFHLMSHLKDCSLYKDYLSSIESFLKNVYHELDYSFKYINLGGGFETRFIMEDNKTNINDLAAIANEKLKYLPYDFELILEPGRYIMADAAVILATIISEKKSTGLNWKITDIGSNILIPVPNIEYYTIPYKLSDINQPWERYNVGDATCAPSHLCTNVELPSQLIENKIIVLNCGAYTSVYSELWAFKLPEIYYLKDNNIQCIFSSNQFRQLFKLAYGYDI
ncbi:hypothetical protein ACFFHF_16440 [Robertmurraya beringensis]|uniref:Orn/DAP/Arg decarboxylase 2 N-terminal domain-containing protein n=1 Tax=Robertmurraya beringensis TaxID=641660 RepID=A0ABV6KUW0_9BACI